MQEARMQEHQQEGTDETNQYDKYVTKEGRAWILMDGGRPTLASFTSCSRLFDVAKDCSKSTRIGSREPPEYSRAPPPKEESSSEPVSASREREEAEFMFVDTEESPQSFPGETPAIAPEPENPAREEDPEPRLPIDMDSVYGEMEMFICQEGGFGMSLDWYC